MTVKKSYLLDETNRIRIDQHINDVEYIEMHM